jgi:hypothetical protein
MKRHLVVAFAALMVMPHLVAAQATDDGWGPKLRITPFLALGPSFTQEGEASVLPSNSPLSEREYELRYGSGFGLGVAAEYRLWNRFGVLASGMWLSRNDGELEFVDVITYEGESTNMWIVKGALSVRLRDEDKELQLHRLNASIYAGPAFILDRPKTEPTTPAGATENENLFALNFGAEAEYPFSNNKLGVMLGLEDYMIFWDDDAALARVSAPILFDDPGAAVAVEPRFSHLWVVRLGLTWRL